MGRKPNGANGSVKGKTSSRHTSTPERDEPWEIKSILNSTYVGSKVYYTVLWDDDSTTREPLKNLIPGSEESVTKFHRRDPRAPMPKKMARKLLRAGQKPVNPNDLQGELEYLRSQNAMLVNQNDTLRIERDGLRLEVETLEDQKQTLKTELARLGNAVVAWGVACSRATTADSNTLLASFGHEDSDMTGSDTAEQQLPAHLLMMAGRQM